MSSSHENTHKKDGNNYLTNYGAANEDKNGRYAKYLKRYD
jgi:hypothetical protein